MGLDGAGGGIAERSGRWGGSDNGGVRQAHTVLGTAAAAAAEQTLFSTVCALRRRHSLSPWDGTTQSSGSGS